MHHHIRLTVFLIPFCVLVAATVASFMDLEGFLRVATALNTWILDTFTHAFAIAGLAFVALGVWAAVSPLGGVRIGGADATPILSRWNWFAITLCTTIAVGILFWATAEPIYHLYAPGGRDIAPGSEAAGEFAMVSLFMHWSFTPYAIYSVPALAFALAYHGLRMPFSMAAPLGVLAGRPLKGLAVDLLDAVALLALVMGIAASLGTGMLSLAGGLGRLTGVETSPLLLAGIAIAVVGAFVASSATGLQRGIRVLSDINAKFLMAFALCLLIAGPTLSLLANGWQALMTYGVEFIPRSLLWGGEETVEWSKGWTVFYWANWLAWAPVTAMFLGRIARGYTVREFLFINLAAPALFSMIWMMIFGGIAIEIDTAENGILKTVLDTSGAEAVLYTVIDRFPFSLALAGVLVFLTFISYVTAADSNTDAIASICQTGRASDTPSRLTLALKLTWAGLIGGAAFVMTAFSGIDGIRMLSNLGGLPALFIVGAMGIALFMMSLTHVKELNASHPGGDNRGKE